MIEMTEETSEPTTRLVYRQSAMDGSNMTGVVSDNVVCFTVGGTAMYVGVTDLPGFMALGATVLAASVTQVEPEESPTEE